MTKNSDDDAKKTEALVTEAHEADVSDAKPADGKEAELNDAFKRLEKQVEENSSATNKNKLSTASRSEKTQRQGSGMNFGSVIALLFAFIALGVGSYGAYTSWTIQQSTANTQYTAQITTLNNELSKLRIAQGQANQNVEAQLQSFTEVQQRASSNLESRLAESMAELQQQAGTSSEDWLLAEAEYLLRLANQRVVMEDDVAGAIALFEAADKIVRDAQGVVAFALRQAIASDIAALKALSGSDIDGIFVQLGAISKQVQSLEQKHLKFEAVELPQTLAVQDATFMQQAQASLVRIGERLASLVDYRNDGEIITPILPPAEEYYLKQNLLLKLQLAQLGLLEGNQRIYEQSLSEAVVWIDQYFNAESSLTISVRGSLDGLRSEVIERDLPDVSGSLREMRALMVNFHKAGERTES